MQRREDPMASDTTSDGATTAHLAHELKNPLTAVKALVQLVMKDAADPRTGHRLGVVLAEVRRMEAILRTHLAPPPTGSGARYPAPAEAPANAAAAAAPAPPPVPANDPHPVDLDGLADDVVAL